MATISLILLLISIPYLITEIQIWNLKKGIVTERVTAKGWFLMCPVYLIEGWESCDHLNMLPRYKLWVLFEFAFFIQQCINFVMSFMDHNSCGFMVRKTGNVDTTVSFVGVI